jgi:uncharacterized protein YjaG (DUF416 family)
MDVTEILFNAALCERETYESNLECNAIPEERARIYLERFRALWEVIEEAELAEDYQRWKEEKEDE